MKSVFIKTYGCQMNEYDSELVASILKKDSFNITQDEMVADIVLVTGCTIRDTADQTAFNYLRKLVARKRKRPGFRVGLIGCLGQRIVNEKNDPVPGIDLYLGPDAYRNIPFLLRNLPDESHVLAENPLEVYDDIVPIRKKGASAWIAISRGCNNKCSYCIVPSTRGAERSRSVDSIVNEVKGLVDEGFIEVTLLGQNVNSYSHSDNGFPHLLEQVSKIDGIKRVRFTTSHPMDMSEDLIYVIRDNEAVCNHIHLPVQSGSDRVLKAMGREYSIAHYKKLIDLMKKEIPDVAITTDIISGFPGETQEDHQQTLDLVKYVEYDGAFTFKYSPRSGTVSYDLEDNIPDSVKTERLMEIGSLQREITARRNQSLIGKSVEVMIESRSKRSPDDALGKAASFRKVIVADCDYPSGTFCKVEINATSSQTLFGREKKIVNKAAG